MTLSSVAAEPRQAISIRALTYGGFAVLVAIIVASSVVSLSAMRNFAATFADLQRLRSASDLAADIDRRMTALRLAARDVVADGSTDPSQPLAAADELASLLVAARAHLSFEDRDMVDGMRERLATYRGALTRLVALTQSRTAALTRLRDDAATSETAVLQLLSRSAARPAETGLSAAAGLLAAERRAWFALADRGAFDPAAATAASTEMATNLAMLHKDMPDAPELGALENAVAGFNDAAKDLAATIDQMNRLDGDVLGREGRLIARTTELLRQSGARTERELAEQLTGAVDSAAAHSLALGLVCAVIGVVAAFWVARRTVEPLRRITAAMRALAAGALETAVPHLGDRTEIGAMARATDVFKRAMIDVDEARQRAGQAEALAADSRRWLREVIDTVPATVTVKDRNRRLVLLNHYGAEVFGVAPGQAEGRTTNELLARYGASKSDAYDQMVMESGRELGFYEDQYPDHTGALRDWLTKKVPLVDAAGEVSHIVSVALDIGERKLAETALRASEERYALAMEAVNEGVYDWNLETGAIYFSPRIFTLVGLARDRLATPQQWLERIHPEDRERYIAATRAHFRGDTPRFECEYRYLHGGGEWRWARQHGIARRGADGRARRMAGSTGDITAAKRHEAELREALDQQTATNDVLNVINRSAFDLQSVLTTVVTTAAALCRAEKAIIYRHDDGAYRFAVGNDAIPEEYARVERDRPIPPGPETLVGRVAQAEAPVRVLDAWSDPLYGPKDEARLGNVRSMLGVPLLRDGRPIGVIALARGAVEPFTDKQIQIVTTFADQTVLAIENARLMIEQREALEQQTAAAEVLRIINSSAGDLAPVFAALLENALRLCDAPSAILWAHDGTIFRAAATHGVAPAFAKFLADWSGPPPSGALDAVGRGEPFIHTRDLAATESYRRGNQLSRAVADLGGGRTGLLIPLRKDGTLLGAIRLYRHEVRPFTDKQIAVLQNFAAQAVVAMENARLLTETREALEKQTATAEILRVISASPTDVQPTFDAIAANATQLCGAAGGGVFRFDGSLIHLAAHHGWSAAALAAVRAAFPLAPGRGSVTARAVLTRAVVSNADLVADPEYAHPAIAQAGHRSTLSIPMLRDGEPVGAITVTRDAVEPFSEAQIDLLKMFADQAVIAIENVRLFNELRESLEYQTATAELLKIVSQSSFELQAVLQNVAASAARLCAADFALIHRQEGAGYRLVASHQLPEAARGSLEQHLLRPGRGSTTGRALLTHETVHIEDVTKDPEYSFPPASSFINYGTTLAVPLMRDHAPAGVITLVRGAIKPFSERQIELVRSFADQAVIAMENARLIGETQEALEQQTATAEMLQVVNSSAGDPQPVFDAMLEKSLRLCGAAFGILRTFDGEIFREAALRGVPPEYLDYIAQHPPYGTGLISRRLMEGERIVHIADLLDTDLYRQGDPARRATADLAGARTYLGVALHKDDRLLGALTIYRREVRPFTDKQIALLRNFAAQAVIAMENTRLLGELQQRQAELGVTFDNMGDGVAMFDAELRLAAWNRNFQELLELPDAFLAEPQSYQGYLRYLAGRGEFGAIDIEAELRRYNANVGRQSAFERTRPDGRVIEVRHNPVPAGGFVLMYSDITERKRAEEEVRASRDAAEAALGELKAAQTNLIQAEKMASLGQLTAGIAHEIKNPLNFVNNFAGLSVELLDELKKATEPALATFATDERAEIEETIALLTSNLEKITQHGRRADNIVKSMLEHSRGVSGERRQVDLNILVEEALNLAYHGARAQDATFNITLERQFDPALAEIELAPQEMTRVFLNLFGNGFYAANKRAREHGDAAFHPVVTVQTREAGNAVEVRVRDNGTGIPPGIKDKLFQPFFTTKPTGEGTGLGLSISYDIVTQQHGGTIEVESEPGRFTEFRVRLPRQHEAAATGRA